MTSVGCQQCRTRSIKARQSSERTVSSSTQSSDEEVTISVATCDSPSSSLSSTCVSPSPPASRTAHYQHPAIFSRVELREDDSLGHFEEFNHLLRRQSQHEDEQPNKTSVREQQDTATRASSSLDNDLVTSSTQISSTRPDTRRHKRQTSYASMNWLLLSLLTTCQLVLIDLSHAFANESLIINISSQSRPSNWHQLSKRGATQAARGAKLVASQEVDALHYLQRYGYMNESLGSSSNLIAEESFQEAVMSFQRFAGIPETGSIDSQTIMYMQMPRCGNKDMGKNAESGRRRRRKKRYALQGSKWRRQELTYRISQYPTRFGHKRHEVDSQIERAFRIWSQVSPIDFVVKKDGRVHIDIRFASGEHGDGDPFDGPGNTLAHAYFPQYGGDAHFDDQEYWTVDSYAGTNIFQVAAHELGHSLGLGHSSVREALMAPFYQKYKPNFKLHADDVLAIQALYGERDSSSAADSPSSSTTTTTESPRRATPSDEDNTGGGFFGFGSSSEGKPVDLCKDAKIDAVTRVEDGSTYMFRGHYYWQIKNEGLAGGPSKISRDWDGLPGNLDAALTWSDGKTFFFKGDKYWRFFNKRREPGYPKQISQGFAGIPNNLDAAFVWSGNGKTYFFKRDKYWRFDSKQEPPVSSQYPKPLKNWLGLPSQSIDDAFKWENGMTYFFKDDLYYRFDDRQFEVDSTAKPAFPRSTAEWWFGCSNSNSLAQRRASESSSSDLLDEDGSQARDLSSSLLFHRRPSQSYDHSSAILSGSRPAGSSISRSIFSGLSALFPSSSTDSSSSSSSASPNDWSYHHGLGEETRKLMRRNGATAARTNSEAASTRWMFPLSSAAASIFSGQSNGRGEQSLSAEMRALPDAQLNYNSTQVATAILS